MSAQTITAPIPQFQDRDGQPLDGGFIYVGTAGLDAQANQIAIFADPAFTIPLSQPVQTLNGYATNGGTPTPLYANASNFSIKILDANGTLVLSAPNFTTRLDAANLTGLISSANMSFQQVGSPIIRTADSKMQDIVSVFDFMTSLEIASVKGGTFGTDVTTAINNAINSGAKQIYFPAGGYLVTNNGVPGTPAVLIGATKTGVTLQGSGIGATIIRNMGNGPAVASVGNAILNNVAIGVSDMTIDGPAGSGTGIFVQYTSWMSINRVSCYSNAVHGIEVEKSFNVSINDCILGQNGTSGLRIGDGVTVLDVGSTLMESNVDGVTISKFAGVDAPRTITFTNCMFNRNSTANAAVGESTDVRFFGCTFETAAPSTTARHVAVDGGAGLARSVLIEGCSFFGNNATTTVVGLFANACEDVCLTNCRVDCTGSDAYAITASAVATRIFDNAALLGTRTNASTSTVVRDVVSAPTPGVAYFTGTSALPISMQAPNNVPLVRFDAQRVWANANNVYTFNVTPANITDGYVVGPGCGDAADFSFLPALPPMGTIYRCRGCNSGSWGTAATAVGAFDQFLIWTGTRWTVIGAV